MASPAASPPLPAPLAPDDTLVTPELAEVEPTLSELDSGTAVEVRFAQVPGSAISNAWLPAVVKRTRLLPARAGRTERQLVIIVLEGDRSTREHSVVLGDPTVSQVRLPPTSTAASINVHPTWVRCKHGAVLVTDTVEHAQHTSFSHCTRKECTTVCGEWFLKFSSTTTWYTSFGGGQFPSIISVKGN